MLPNFSGEFFIYNLISDKLGHFEARMSGYRDTFSRIAANLTIKLASHIVSSTKAYFSDESMKVIIH